MKLSTEKETEIVAAYKSFWIANLSANMEVFGSYLVDDFSIIGSAKGETFFSRKDTVAFYAATADELKDKAELRNRAISMQPMDKDSVIIHELCDLYVLIENDWTFYGHARISCVMKKVEGAWKAVHQHASFPDHRTEEGQQLASEKIEKENLELKEAVHRRTVELEAKNRELEIETSLEKVRAVAMAMNTADDLLKICEVLFKELYKIGFKEIRCALIHIFKDERGYFDDYDYSDFTGGKISAMPYKGNKVVEDFLKGIRKSDDSFAEVVVKGEALADFISFRKKTGQMDDPRLLNAAEISYYFYSVGSGNIGISNFGKIENAQLLILKRFRNVFELAYRRYLDIEKAIAQTREAQVEAALERVRAKTMAMQQSGELAETASLLFHQVKLLGIDVYTAGFTIWDEEEENLASWVCNADGSMNPPFLMPYKENDWHYQQYTSWKNGEDFIAKDLNGEAMKSYFQYLRSFPLLDKAFKISIAAGHPMPERQVHNVANFSQGNLLFITYVPVPEAHDIFKRFGKVFEQTYTRFLDLQKAEAQAREAQIEVAVERVRAQSMAMHHPDDLNNVNKEILKQLNWLQIQGLSGVTFYLVDEKGLVKAWDFSSPGNIGDQTSYTLQFDYNKYEMMGYPFKILLETDQDYFVADYPLEKLQKAVYEIEEINPAIASVVKEALSTGVLTHQWAACARISNGMLGIDMVNQPNEGTKAIVLKMAGAFNQAYTRFLDLQKAEAQAREAQINLAVERVRAKALAMYSSEEILEVVFKLKEEVMNLNIPNVMAATIHMIEKNGKHRMWDISSMEAIEGKLHLPLDISFRLEETDPNFFIRRVWTNTEKYFLVTQDEKDLKRTTQWLKDNGKTKEADETVEFIKATGLKKLYHPTIQLNSGRMCIDLLEEPSGEIESILTKMGAAFDLAYTRFEDLKNSEAQLKEAQTEAALEKVRARTMAMQHSDELADASRLLEEEVRKLGIETWGCAFHIYDEENTDEDPWDLEWFTSPAGMLPFYKTPRENIFLKYYNEGKKGTKLHIEEIGPDEIKKHYDYLKSIPIMGDALKEMSGAGVPLPQMQFDHIAFFKQGHLLFITYKPVPEAHDIFIRFAKIFDQTYTRFLDLQKAEAQAREAQIELALERVRSQAMAMQKSSDLLDIVVTMRNEFTRLGYEAHYFWHMMWLPEKYEKAMTSGDGTKIGFVMELPRHIHGNIPLLAKWEQSSKPTVIYAMNVDEALDYVDKMVALGNFKNIDPQAPTHDDIRHIGGLTFVMARTMHGEIGYSLPGMVEHPPKEDVDILVRFAGAFDIAHRRFLDLQKSEAQSREVEIELALEKVRSRSMGMQKSEELKEVIKIVYQQLSHLKIKLDHAGFVVDYKPKGDWHFWIADEQDIPSKITHPWFESVWANQFDDAKEKGKDIFTTHLDFEEKNKFYNELLSYVPTLPEASKDFYLTCPGLAATTVLLENVSLYMENFAGNLYSDQENKILLRFGNVFQQTYTRFLDLQKAEALAKQAEQDVLEIKTARQKAEIALVELQTTQKQLIQSEKMASLGELTAGIAHEIQNPLNFVNNFSEVSKELLDEMKAAMDNGDAEEAKELATDIIQNLEKITHHGKRADAIVKGMLQHSRAGSSQKELADINALADEYLRLAFHGLRAKDKSFNATLKTDYDNSIGNINIIPQDIGRVILNLITNAFYVVDEKKKSGIANYDPAVIVSTKNNNGNLELSVRDNGNGIPPKVLHKIFQPFFTTKPTGQGTGLGLSLAYDIVKAHGGELLVETKEGEGSTFIIHLPIS